MKTLEQVKKNKNYLAYAKGYPMDPEGFPLYYLMERLADEYQELKDAITLNAKTEFIIDELADMSNIIDYISTKLIVDYPTVYKRQKGIIDQRDGEAGRFI